jgi:cytoskeletal protein RodZ
MNLHRKLALAMLLTLLVGGSVLTLPMFSQSKSKKDEQKKQEPQKTDEQKKTDEQPAPLFEGKMNLKSSRQGKDSASLGFSGVGPNGEIEQKVLEATPTGADQQKASEMGNRRVAPDALQLFIVEGQLNPQGAPKSQK